MAICLDRIALKWVVFRCFAEANRTGFIRSSPRAVREAARAAGTAAPAVPKVAAAIPGVIRVNTNVPQWNEQLNQAPYQPPAFVQNYVQGGAVDPLRRLPDREAILRSLLTSISSRLVAQWS